jgi:hypothetical protein
MIFMNYYLLLSFFIDIELLPCANVKYSTKFEIFRAFNYV